MLVRKHALNELQLLIATTTALYHTGEKLTITITQGEFHPQPQTFHLSGKMETASTSLQTPVEKSDNISSYWRALVLLPLG